MNKYLEQMKAAVVEYRSAAQKAAKEMAENTERLNAEYSDEANSAILSRLEAKKREAQEKISAATEAGISGIKEWARLDGSKITADAELLKYGVTPAQFDDLVDRYKENGTMLSLLRKYGSDQNTANRDNAAAITYDVSRIPKEEDRIHAYKIFGNTARSYIDALSGNGFVRGSSSAMLNVGIDNFGEPQATNIGFLELL